MAVFTFAGANDVAVELVPVADHLHLLFPEERDLIARAVDKRKAEFASGRAAAHAVMRRHRMQPVPVLRNDRAPVWPEGFIGSIAHSTTWAMATLMPRTRVRALGVDLERHDRMKAEMLRMVLTPNEIARLESVDLHRALTVFSAKEAVFKAINPMLGEFIGFREVEIDIDGSGFTARYVGAKGLEIMNTGEGFVADHEQFLATLFIVR